MFHFRSKKNDELKGKANQIRQTVIEMLAEAGSGHTAGSLGMADIFTALYFGGILKYESKNPDWPDRDRLILSNGHICPVLYATMAHAGYFLVEECLTLRKFGSRLQGHPEREKLPGVETTSGPLGCGLGQAAGVAYGARMDRKTFRVFCLMSDGEQDEGNTWESAMFCGKNKLTNLTALIDRNNIQIDGKTEDTMPLEPLREKYEAFGWQVLEIDGHNFDEIITSFERARGIIDKPVLIIAHTIPGKGLKEIEGDFKWHGNSPTKTQAEKFIKELKNA